MDNNSNANDSKYNDTLYLLLAYTIHNKLWERADMIARLMHREHLDDSAADSVSVLLAKRAEQAGWTSDWDAYRQNARAFYMKAIADEYDAPVTLTRIEAGLMGDLR